MRNIQVTIKTKKKKFAFALLHCKRTHTHVGNIGVMGIHFHSFLTEAVDRGMCPASINQSINLFIIPLYHTDMEHVSKII